MDELDKRFDALFGEVLSEEVEKGESDFALPIGYSYQSHPCTLVDPVSGAELITGNYYDVTLDEVTKEQYPELSKALDDFNLREEEGIREEMATYQKDALNLKIEGVDWSFQLEEDFIPQRATVAFEDFPDLFTDTYVNYKDGTKPDIAGLATNENDAEKKTIDATESMWD